MPIPRPARRRSGHAIFLLYEANREPRSTPGIPTINRMTRITPSQNRIVPTDAGNGTPAARRECQAMAPPNATATTRAVAGSTSRPRSIHAAIKTTIRTSSPRGNQARSSRESPQRAIPKVNETASDAPTVIDNRLPARPTNRRPNVALATAMKMTRESKNSIATW